jgi:hypothetical protein
MNSFRHYFGSPFRSLLWGAGIALAILSAGTPAFADIARPGDIIAGYTQLQLAQAWWQWAVGVPAPNNPLLDTTGANAGVNNNGPVFFVAGVSGSGTVVRTFNVPLGKPIFVPVVNGFYVPIGADGGYDPSPCTDPLQFSCAIQTATGSFSPLHSMSLQIDGVALNIQQLRAYRQTSTSYFTATLPANNIFGVPVPPLPPRPVSSSFWVQDGYYVTLTNLSPGSHLLVFHAAWGAGAQLNVIDKINVVP